MADWDELVSRLRDLPNVILGKLPDDVRADPQIRQEARQLALQAFICSAIEAVGGDGDFPEFLPSFGHVLNIAQPNTDTIYRMARITPGGCYRITGRQGSAVIAVISQAVPGEEHPGGAWPELDLTNAAVDGEGRYDVLVSPARPQGCSGDWWQLAPGANRLMLRIVSAGWANARAPTIAIERVDRAMGRRRLPATELEPRLRDLPPRFEVFATLFLPKLGQLRAEGYVNRLKQVVSKGTMARQSNYEGVYELDDDEALIVESAVPEKCEYRSLLLINELYQTIDCYNNQSSLNNAEAAPDSDGRLRIVIAARDPGVRNWLDPAGHRRGIVKGRWTGCDSHPVPEIRLVRFDELDRILPADTARVTPEQRETFIRERRRALLERALW